MAKDKRLIIAMKLSKHKELKVFAAKQGKTMNFIIQQALREFLIKHEESINKEK